MNETTIFLMAARGSDLHFINANSFKEEGWEVAPMAQGLIIKQGKRVINVVFANNLEAERIIKQSKEKERFKKIFISVNERRRAFNLAQDLSDQSLLRYVDAKDYCTIPEVWMQILEDRRMYSAFSCNYMINGNQSSAKIIKALKRIIREELKQC